MGQELVHDCRIVRLAEELDDGVRDDRPDSIDNDEVVPGFAFRILRRLHGGNERGGRMVGAGEDLGIALADMANTQREDESMQIDIAPRLDRLEQIGGALLPPSPRDFSAW